jgi:ATP-dependent DNA ligase
VFDLMVLRQGRDERVADQAPLREQVLAKLNEPIRESPELEASLSDLIHSVKANGLEGLVTKRRDSRYEPGERPGAWQKMRVDRGQPFVNADYTPASKNFDTIVFGYYDAGKLVYAGRTRNGFAPSSRSQLFNRFGGARSRRGPAERRRRAMLACPALGRRHDTRAGDHDESTSRRGTPPRQRCARGAGKINLTQDPGVGEPSGHSTQRFA